MVEPATPGGIEALEAQVGQLQRRLAAGEPADDLHDRLWRLYRRLARMSHAVVHARAWLEASHDGIEPPDELWLLLSEAGDVESEVVVLSRKLALAGEDFQLRSRLIRRLARLGRKDEAQVHLDALAKAADLTPEALIRWSRISEDIDGRGGLPDGQGVTLVFPHAHKTGGASLCHAMGAMFGDGLLWVRRANAGALLHGLPLHERGRIDAIAGHFSYDWAEDSPLVMQLPRSPAHLGLARDPVARAKSIYAFFRKGRSDPLDLLGRLRVPDDDDLNVVVERWLRSDCDWSGWRHSQCRAICGEPGAAEAIRTIERRYLAAATTERIGELVRAIADGLSLPPPQPVRAKRTYSEDLVLAPELERRLREHQSQDQRLFEWVDANADRLIERAADKLRAMTRA